MSNTYKHPNFKVPITTQQKFNDALAAGTLIEGLPYEIEGLCPEIFYGTEAPTSSVSCSNVGDFYIVKSTQKVYQCVGIDGTTYTWREIGAGGASGGHVIGYRNPADDQFYEDSAFTPSKKITPDVKMLYIDLGSATNNLYRYDAKAETPAYELVSDVEWDAGLITATLDIGGVKKGDDLTGKTIQQVLEMLVSPYVAPVLAAPATDKTPSGTMEHGTTSTVTKVYANWVNGSKPVTELILEGAATGSVTSPTGTAYTFTIDPITISEGVTKTFTLRLKDGTSELNKSSIVSNNYRYPYYVGTCQVEVAELDAETIQATYSSSRLGNPGSYKYTTNDSSPFIVTESEIKKVTDDSGVTDYTNSFKHKTIELSSTNPVWGPKTFHAYVGPSGTAENFTYKFTY